MEIRKCLLGEVGILRDLALNTFDDTYRTKNDPENYTRYIEENFSTAKLESELSDSRVEYFVLFVESNPAAYIKLNYDDAQTNFQGDEYAEIERIYVKREFKRKGLGRKLMDFACTAARSRTKSKLWLGVWSENPQAISFYQNYGLVKIGEHDFMMGNEAQNDWIMELIL